MHLFKKKKTLTKLHIKCTAQPMQESVTRVPQLGHRMPSQARLLLLQLFDVAIENPDPSPHRPPGPV